MMGELDLLRNLYQRAVGLRFDDHQELDDIRRKGKMALENLFPGKSYASDISHIRLKGTMYGGPSSQAERNDWSKGRDKLANLLDTAIKDYEFQLNKDIIKRSHQIQEAKLPELIVKEKIVSVVDSAALEKLTEEFALYRRSVVRWIMFALALAIPNMIIWGFYISSSWEWYANHQKKVGLTLLTSLTVVLFALSIPVRKWVVWILAGIAALTTLFTML
jgi:hypothetical protein